MNTNLYYQINKNIEAFILNEFRKKDEIQIDCTKIVEFIKQKNINLIITTRGREELNLIEQYSEIVIVSNLKGNIMDIIQDRQTIANHNQNIIQSKKNGRFLYLIDNYQTMLKYIISLKLLCNSSSQIDQYTETLIKEMELGDFFPEEMNSLATQHNSSLLEQNPLPQIVKVHNLPQPIHIPFLQIQMNQNLIQSNQDQIN